MPDFDPTIANADQVWDGRDVDEILAERDAPAIWVPGTSEVALERDALKIAETGEEAVPVKRAVAIDQLDRHGNPIVYAALPPQGLSRAQRRADGQRSQKKLMSMAQNRWARYAKRGRPDA